MKWMKWMARWLMAATLLAAGLGARAATDSEYVLGGGDQIRVSVYQNPDLTLETRISELGTISFPLIGTVKIGGMTVSAAEKKIEGALKEGNFIKQPQVSILMLAFKGQMVSVLGFVNRPGRYALSPLESKLSQLVAQAGGTVGGNSNDILIVTGTRNGKPFRREIDFPMIFYSANGEANDITLENGDTVYVDRAPLMYIYGEVQRPGQQILLRDMTVLQALAAAGGLNQRGTERGIRIHRRDPATGETKIIQPKMSDLVQPNDVVYVKESLF